MIRELSWPWVVMIAGMLAGGLETAFDTRPAWAADTVWLAGEPLRQALGQNVGITWANLPARKALESLSKTQRVAVMLDRRVDPDKKIELVVGDVPLAEALERIASRLQIGVTMMGPVAYFGPKPTALRLRTVAALRDDEAEHLPAAIRSHWTQAKPWKWDMLAAPRDLLTDLGRENGVKIEGLEQIPADLWSGANLPALTLPERLSLILAQYDLTYEPAADGTSIRLVPMPEKPVIERSYPLAGLPADTPSQLRQNKLLADAQIDAVNNKLRVRGRQEDQDVVADVLAGHAAHKTSVAEGRKVYTLRVELPVGKLLDA
jgi:hypothetical protein